MRGSHAKIAIRRAHLADAGAIAKLGGQLGYPATEKELAERLAKLIRRPGEDVVLIAEASGETVGWLHVSVTPLLEVPLSAEVNGLIVDEANRSQGAGAKLLEAAERWAADKGCKRILVRSNVIRERAHGFYLRHGYEHFKTQKVFHKSLKVAGYRL